LAQSSGLNRSLKNLGTAVESGDLASAGSILSAIKQANPQFAASADSGTASQSPINQDFQTLNDALANNQTDAAQSAWTQLKSDLASNGISITKNSASTTAQVLAQSRESLDLAILSNFFGSSSSSASLLGATSTSARNTDWQSTLSQWLTYKANGNASTTAAAGTTAGSVDASA
jgi:hypothetical protein